MKVISLDKTITKEELFKYLTQNMNDSFHQRRQTAISFYVRLSNDEIQIMNKDLYEDVLFKIKVNDNEINIWPSEHYTDDINAITLEDILFTLIGEYPYAKVELITTRSVS